MGSDSQFTAYLLLSLSDLLYQALVTHSSTRALLINHCTGVRNLVQSLTSPLFILYAKEILPQKQAIVGIMV